MRDQSQRRWQALRVRTRYLADNGHPLTAGFNEDHQLDDPGVVLVAGDKQSGARHPESLARKALRLPEIKHQPVMKESDIAGASGEVVQKKILGLRVDPETPESFMLRPKRRRWVNERLDALG